MLGCGFLQFNESQGVDRAIANLVFHKTEPLCVVGIFRRLIVRVLFGLLFDLPDGHDRHRGLGPC